MFKREIEKKYVLKGITMSDAHELLFEIFGLDNFVYDVSTDTFWQAPDVDFIRLRANTNELTVKITDQETIVNRVEENLLIKSFDDAKRWATAIWGEPVGTLEKSFYVYYLDDAVLSLYTVTGFEQVFLEIESDNLTTINEIESDMLEEFDMTQEYRSLFQIIFGGKRVKRKQA